MKNCNLKLKIPTLIICRPVGSVTNRQKGFKFLNFDLQFLIFHFKL
jgi:hypothetical protein